MQLGTLSRNLLYIRLRIATTNVSESTDGGRTGGDLGGGEKMGRKKERTKEILFFFLSNYWRVCFFLSFKCLEFISLT